MSFLIMLITAFIAYNVWRITDQLPDLVFRLSEIQRDLAEVRRGLERADDARSDHDGGGTGTA